MARPHSISRTLAALVLLALAVVLLASLGRWQLKRADERRATLHTIEAGRVQPPLTLGTDVPPAALTPWRPARAVGQWRDDLTVVLENRNHDGRPGFWLATPLVLDASRNVAVLVLRGWVARAVPGQPQPPFPPAPPGEQMASGELVTHVPRLFELWGMGAAATLPPRLPAPDGTFPKVQNLALDDYARATGLTLVPAVLQQLAPDAPGLSRDWPQPSVDYNQNQGYALQWFAFAAIAAIAWLVVVVRAWRRRRAASPD